MSAGSDDEAMPPLPEDSDAPAPAPVVHSTPSVYACIRCATWVLLSWKICVLSCVAATIHRLHTDMYWLLQPQPEFPLADDTMLAKLPVSVHGDEVSKLLPDVSQYGSNLHPPVNFNGVPAPPGGRRLLRANPMEGSAPGEDPVSLC